jgi:hypothetical protein
VRLTLIDERQVDVDADVDGERVLISPAELEWATGWELKPEGLCKGDICVVLHEPVSTEAGRVDLSAIARALRRSMAISIEGGVAALAGDPMGTGQTGSIDDLELPDVDGTVVRPSDHAGRKRLLVAWASW